MNSIVYELKDSLYLNITNRCMNRCFFCIRYKSRVFNGRYELWLEQEPTVKEIISAIGDPLKYKEIIFCGYGEPLIRLDTVKKVAKKLKIQKSKVKNNKNAKVKIRIDTNGLANLFYQRNILPELEGLIDIMSISLNAESPEVYNKICHSIYGEKAYPAVMEFIKESKKYIPKVEVTVVDIREVNIDKSRAIAEELGIDFRVRPYYEEKYRESE